MKSKSPNFFGSNSKMTIIYVLIAIVIIILIVLICINLNKKSSIKESLENLENVDLEDDKLQLENVIHKSGQCPKRAGYEVKWVCKDVTDENGNIIRSGCGCVYRKPEIKHHLPNIF
jgi:hypothetical protein